MSKTLVTLGYHYGELEWGRQVRDEYIRRQLQGDRDITFYEVSSSDVETGYPSAPATDEIKEIVRKKCYQLLIDIHCGFDARYEDNDVLISYLGMDSDVILRMRQLKGVHVDDWRAIGENSSLKRFSYYGIPYANVDAFFSTETFIKKGQIYRKKIKRTLEVINQIHDSHRQFR